MNKPVLYLDLKVLCLLALCADVAFARAEDASNEFPGVYVLEGARIPKTSLDRELLDLKCVLAPAVMNAGGLGAGYYLDLASFRKTGAIIYVKGQEYKCRYNPGTRMETCQSTEFSNGKSLRYYRTNVYQQFNPDLQQGHTLLTPEDVAAWNSSGTLNPTGRFAYHRCHCLTADKVEANVSPEANQLSGEETGTRLFWWKNEPSAADYETARQVMQTLKGCGPNLS